MVGFSIGLEWYGRSKSTERIVTGFWSWETAAVADKTCDFAAGLMDFGDGFHRLRVVSLTGLGICVAMRFDIRKDGQYPDQDCGKSLGQHRFPKKNSIEQGVFLERLLLERTEGTEEA